MVATHTSSGEGAGSMTPVKRTRKQSGKSRQGCSRCKSRRIKCDETRPACNNCIKLGNQCPGFQQQIRWSAKHEKQQTIASSEELEALSDQHVDDAVANQPTNLGGEGVTNKEVENSNATQGSYGGPASQFVDPGPEEQLPFPADWPSTADLDALLETNPDEDAVAVEAFEFLGLAESQPDSIVGQSSSLSQTLAHLPTLLIEHWFRYVCPMWSAFDSEVNYNRQLARSTWSMSAAVFYAMQAMSAACLMSSMPTLIDTLPLLRAQATTSITLSISKASKSTPRKVTADLVFAVFALGTSLPWSKPAPTELPWLQVARELLSSWQVEASSLDSLLHAYFCQALTYWEMLLTASGLGSMPEKVARKQRQHQIKLHQALQLPNATSDAVLEGPQSFDPGQNLLGTRPNSWCGVSNEVIDVFGQVLALCRSARQHSKQTHALTTMAGSTTALCDLALAHDFQRELVAMDFGTLLSVEEAQGFLVQTQDDKTPIDHLVLTAEAYRQAGILQLHLAFRELHDPAMTEQAHAGFTLTLSRQLVATLEKIPVESGSRTMHTMLYLSAAAGLKCDTVQIPAFADSQSTWAVATARHFVWTRLSSMQQTMPQRASDSTLQLIKAIWLEYDAALPGCPGIHWLDLIETGAGTTMC